MNPNVVLSVLLEMIDGAWVFIVVVTVIRGEEEEVWRKPELTHCRSELASMGDGVVQAYSGEGSRYSKTVNCFLSSLKTTPVWMALKLEDNCFVSKVLKVVGDDGSKEAPPKNISLCALRSHHSPNRNKQRISVSRVEAFLSTGETEGEEGILQCKLINEVRNPISAVSERDLPLSGAFESILIPETSVSLGHPFCVHSSSSYPLVSSHAFQRGSVSISPVVYDNHRGGASCSKGVVVPLETSNQKSKDRPFLREIPSNLEVRGDSGEALFPVQEPSTLPLEGFQVEGLTPRKMVKVQSVLESLRVRIVRDNGKGVVGENRNPLSADKVYSRRKRILELEERISPGCGLCWVVIVLMKILSWNTRGLGSRKKRRTVRRFLSTQNPDVVMLQETKREIWDRRLVSSIWKGKSLDWVALPACGASGGIVILWDSVKFNCSEKVLGSFSVTVKLNSDEEGSFWLSSVYGPNKAVWREDFWLELQDLHGLTFPRWCVGGDFNVIRRIFEKMGDSSLTVNMRRFDEFIRESGLLDPPLRNAAFTWSNMQVDPICKRLDRFLFSAEWDSFFSQNIQEALPRWTSDHSPICLETNPFMWGPTPFRFENMWLLHPEFKEKFRDWWILRRKELEDLLLKEEVQWRQKSRVKWIKEGDCNSKFFHRVATGRRSRKYIKSLISERGETLNNIEVISEEIVNFFGNLYSKPEGDSWKIEGIDWAPISEESAIWLDRPFSEEEVRMAVFQLNKEKAPGPDGFTLAVYQECWDVIKEDLMRVFFEFHTKGVINQSTNATFIAMVPKKSQTFKISDYRPISLVTSLYKIIAKVLSGRLRKVLHETIFGSQGAFVEGRQILDAVLIANEVVDEKRRSGEEGVVFKIDFEKAYDHVEWGFLDHVLQRKGFNQKWRSWMRGCLSSSSFAILVNGNAKGWVKASRGLRQGDPLSPFLFTLVADVLSRLMIRAEETGITEGFLVGRDRTRVSLLQFADDTIFFSKASLDILQNLKIILLVFGQVSGLKINLGKSTISGINTRQEMLSSLALVLECRVSEWPLSYLGLPLGGNPKTIGFWDPVVERISRRLDGWKKAYLSLGGRITLIQSCLSHIPSYFLSLFKIPVSIASKIEKMQRDFLWSGAGEGKRDHLIRWEVVSRPREMGGLGFGKTSMRNSALLGKWLWTFPRERSGLWHKVIASIYGTHPNGWDANMVVRWSHRCPWKAIAQVFQEFSPFVRLVVGNGERIRFWEDLWWGNQTLCAQFAELYRVSSVRNLTVSNVLGNSFPLS
ncbi:LINE-1 retrotransposable element ORF2 protein [Vitis vinifera]|uniref:LINE-1 retrotransposable element ORF2 protein n=1 Tax=Vitis vinifera TaxID=29760 RepID=A0A438H302_VITVI|nr:LINE-1 retrotransposable element ORF2 protein [Vitis vinifera]